MTRVGYILRPSGLNAGFSKSSLEEAVSHEAYAHHAAIGIFNDIPCAAPTNSSNFRAAFATAQRQKALQHNIAPPELLKIPLHIHIWQIWHHVRHYFEASILGKLEAAEHCLHRVPPDQACDGPTMKTVRYVVSWDSRSRRFN